MFLLVATTIGTRICFSGVPAIDSRDQRFAGLLAHEIGLLHAGGDDLALLQKIDEFRNAVEGRDKQRAVAMARLDGAKRAKGGLVSLDEHRLHVRVGGQHVLGELERLVGGIGLHLLQSGLLGDAQLLFIASRKPAVRAWPFLRACEIVTSPTEPSVQPLSFSAAASASPTPMCALIVVGDDERDIVAAIGADVGDHDRNLRARCELQNARAPLSCRSARSRCRRRRARSRPAHS